MSVFSTRDTETVRSLAREYAEIANSDYNKRSCELAYNCNDLKGGRPFVAIDELPWVELNSDPELKCVCEDDFARDMEDFFRSELYRFRHFPTNRIFHKCWYVGKSYDCEGFGMSEHADIIEYERGNGIVSHRYHDQLPDEESLQKMKPITVIPHPEEDEENLLRAEELLGGIMPVRLRGTGAFYIAPWDNLVRFHTVENTLYDLVDRPEFLHAMMSRYVGIYTDMIEQMEKYGLLDSANKMDNLHCTAPFTVSLPSEKPADESFGMKDIWIRCTAQTLGSCSPAMYNEFEIEHMKPLISRFGLSYYGCCEPLERVIPYLKNIPNLRKIGVSPFADVEMSAEQIGGDYVLSRKPNPSYLSGGFSADTIRAELMQTVEICEKYGCSYDYVLKDISTVGHDPERLSVWAKTVGETLDAVYGK